VPETETESETAPELIVDLISESPLWNSANIGAHLTRALSAAAAAEGRGGEVSLLLADDARVAGLNQAWRKHEGPTNVLAFPSANAASGAFLGDIALAAETIAAEAAAQGKSLDAHAAHLAVHGFLHLLGYEHDSPQDAETMEARERAILASLGIADPYA
jgi:probable rRNA maturation factor